MKTNNQSRENSLWAAELIAADIAGFVLNDLSSRLPMKTEFFPNEAAIYSAFNAGRAIKIVWGFAKGKVQSVTISKSQVSAMFNTAQVSLFDVLANGYGDKGTINVHVAK